MKIVFIGAGNLATRLALELHRHGLNIIQVFSRTIESAEALSSQIGARAVNDINNVADDADLYIFSVKDSVLPDLLNNIPVNNGIWVHTAGSIPMDIFEGYNNRYGVVYPFQTFSKNRNIDFSSVPFLIEANDTETLQVLRVTFGKISEKQIELSSEKRKYLHLTGVFACNFVNHMYTISHDILQEVGISFDTVLPLIDETAAKIHEMTPKDAQTGPAIRFDKNVIDKHLALINDEQRKQIYELISKDIHKKNKE